jgi:hypothetical protein
MNGYTEPGGREINGKCWEKGEKETETVNQMWRKIKIK